ncbi:periplasmic divalent cation tolerance protein [Tamaricihabitans halophyticus]|uniref:Periplasmic divalent cation tolerance protein n=1 Tax=Tamaricihabitans halophyticus TaxID=1262583 RepID=A0A4R2R2G3_9PSEU|nr:divalent-cation tolerance protein CutA [Tamaricihabitans halophyticus]TCP56930.1 periplasmic divalent cation tolerance protein [Tamaricihabitans halophyticus]
MGEYLLVSTTTEDRATAARLASSAVKARLAASGQVVGPVASYFWHLGEAGEGEEWQVLLKTTAARYAELEAHLIAEHSWNKPEVTAIPLVAGAQPYLDWLDASTTDK